MCLASVQQYRDKNTQVTQHEIGNCERNLPKMSQGAKTNGNS